MQVSDLDWSLATESWLKQPIYFSYQAKPNCEHLVQNINLPPMHRGHRFRADEGASWDCIAENAIQATHKHYDKEYMDKARTYGAETKSILVIVLLYASRCNPFTLMDLDVLRRARSALEDGYTKVAVAGAVVVPCSDSALAKSGAHGRQSGRHLDFPLRVEVAREVIASARESKWVLVDSCMEGCLRRTPGKVSPYVAVYAKGRLHNAHYEPRVLEVCAEDVHETRPKAERAFGRLYVDPVERPSVRPPLDSVVAVQVAVPKQSLCNELLEDALRKPTDVNNFATLDRFCGKASARLIHDRFRMRLGQIRRGSESQDAESNSSSHDEN